MKTLISILVALTATVALADHNKNAVEHAWSTKDYAGFVSWLADQNNFIKNDVELVGGNVRLPLTNNWLNPIDGHDEVCIQGNNYKALVNTAPCTMWYYQDEQGDKKIATTNKTTAVFSHYKDDNVANRCLDYAPDNTGTLYSMTYPASKCVLWEVKEDGDWEETDKISDTVGKDSNDVKCLKKMNFMAQASSQFSVSLKYDGKTFGTPKKADIPACGNMPSAPAL